MTPLERRCRWLLRAYPAWYRRKRAGEVLDTLLQASPPGRTWPSVRDARALITGGMRVRGWIWFLSMLWVTAGAGYALLMAANTYTSSGSLFPETGVPVVVDAMCWLPVVAWVLLPVPVLVTGFVRIRGWSPRNWLRTAVWGGTWITGFALMNQAVVWAGDWFPGYGYPVENLRELGICAAWLALGAAMTWILAVPAHRRDAPGTSGYPARIPADGRPAPVMCKLRGRPMGTRSRCGHGESRPRVQGDEVLAPSVARNGGGLSGGRLYPGRHVRTRARSISRNTVPRQPRRPAHEPVVPVLRGDRAMRLKRQEISEAVSDLGWRLILGELRAQVRTASLVQAVQVAATAVGAADGRMAKDGAAAGAEKEGGGTGDSACGHLRLDLRGDRVYLSVCTRAADWVTALDIELARVISRAVGELGLTTDAGLAADARPTTDAGLAADAGRGAERAVQVVEIGIDALDIPAIRPFWKAILDYADVPGSTDPEDAILDPAGQGPAIWFQQMDAPRPQRNRIHLDIAVPHDEAQRRMDAAIAVGGALTYTDEAPAFWVLADLEGNEACICTWQARD